MPTLDSDSQTTCSVCVCRLCTFASGTDLIISYGCRARHSPYTRVSLRNLTARSLRRDKQAPVETDRCSHRKHMQIIEVEQ